MQLYVEALAAAATPENIITEDRPQDDRAWEVYIEQYTPRTLTHVMHVPA
jgi:hypothetical protein